MSLGDGCLQPNDVIWGPNPNKIVPYILLNIRLIIYIIMVAKVA